MRLVNAGADKGFYCLIAYHLLPCRSIVLQEGVGNEVGCMKEAVIEDKPVVQAEQVGILAEQSLTDGFIVDGGFKQFRKATLQGIALRGCQLLHIVVVARKQTGGNGHHALYSCEIERFDEKEKVVLNEGHVAFVCLLEQRQEFCILLWMVVVPAAKGQYVQFIGSHLGCFLLLILLAEADVVTQCIRDCLGATLIGLFLESLGKPLRTIIKDELATQTKSHLVILLYSCGIQLFDVEMTLRCN